MRNLIFWGLFPFALPQALWVRKTAPRFAAAEGPSRGSVGAGEPLRLLAVGDSIVAGVGARRIEDALVAQTAKALAELLSRRVEWSAHGRIGARSRTLLDEFIPALPPEPADVVLLSVGVNDVTSLTAQPVWERNLDRVLRGIGEHSGDAVVAVAGIPPLGGFPLLPQPLRFASGQRGRSFDHAARRVVADHANAIHVPVEFDTTPDRFSADGFHPSEQSYREFGAAFAAEVAGHIDARPGRARRARDGEP